MVSSRDAFVGMSFVLAVNLLVCPFAVGADGDRPNVVVILTDNHGAWTLGCYGNRDIRTPHIDRLAAEGTRFDRAFACNPVCSPTRATLLTGLMPSQHGVHCFLRGGRLQVGPEARNTLAEFTSLGEILKDAGYRCGLVGKWHLGANMTPQEGFDDYWITMPHGGTSTFYDATVIEDGKLRNEPKYLTDLWTDHAARFIRKRADDQRPFFLYLAYNGPYALGRLLLRESRNRHAGYYADKELLSFPREPTHPWQFSNRDYINNPLSIRRVACEVSGIDDGVGQVMQALRDAGVEKNTIVIFLGDQGWVGGHGGFWGMGDHTRPLTVCDGMMRIPMIWWQPGHVAEGAVSDDLVANYDVLPTLLDHMGMSERMPQSPQRPGRSFAAPLAGKSSDSKRKLIFFEFENLRSVRSDRWKYVHRFPNGPMELYDLHADPEEKENRFGDRELVAVEQRLASQLEAFFQKYAEPKYDLYHGGSSQTVLFQGIDEEAAQVQPVAPPLPANFTTPKMNVPEGYTVELAAGPPLVSFPMMAAFDDRGRLFVADSAGKNLRTSELEQQLPNYVRMLEDTDQDGRFDKSTIFADKMTLPMGALWHDGALYVASPPNIWRLEDTNDDGVADRRDVLVSRFGYSGNAASVHGCFLGPDGRIYWCDGRHGHEFRDAEGNVKQRRDGSYIFSCLPDGSDVRPHCGGGMDNPVEVDFTESGQILGTVNILYRAPRNDCLVHWLHGGVYPHSERVLGEFKRTGDLLGPVHRFGHVAVSGTTRYRSGVMDRTFRDDWFVTIFNTGKLLRCDVEPAGATYQAEQHEFLTCDSRDFHPTDVLEDADGSLLLVDTGGWFRIGCPTSQIAKPDVPGAIYRIRRRGMTTVVDPWGKRIDWPTVADRKLLTYLNDTRFKVRERAIAECARRGDAMVTVLAAACIRGDVRVRRNAVWALTRIGSPKAISSLLPSLGDANASIRLAAVTGLASVSNAKMSKLDAGNRTAVVRRLVESLNDEQPSVRRQAATALGRIGSANAVPALFEALSRKVDRGEEHALIYALIELDAAEATAKGLADIRPAVHRAALIAIDQMENGSLTETQVLPLLTTENAALRKTAIEIVKKNTHWSRALRASLERWLSQPAIHAGRRTELQSLLTAFLNDPAIAGLVGRALDDRNSPFEMRECLLKAISAGHDLPLHESWTVALNRSLASDDPKELQAAIQAVSAIQSDRFDERLQQIAANSVYSMMSRVASLEATARRHSEISDAAFSLLLQAVDDGTRPEVVARVSRMIGDASLSDSQLIALIPYLRQAGPLELRDFIRPFARSGKLDTRRKMLAALRDSPGFAGLATVEFSDVIKRFPAELFEDANTLLSVLQERDSQRQNRVEQLHAQLGQGDATRGKKLFEGKKAKCSVCHRIAGEGGTIGPDLSQIGKIRSRRDLVEAIVFPSASFAREYEPYNVLTISGKIHNGLVVDQNDDRITLQPPTGSPILIATDEIEEIRPSTVSIMPQGLESAIDETGLADLVAYLKQLTSRED